MKRGAQLGVASIIACALIAALFIERTPVASRLDAASLAESSPLRYGASTMAGRTVAMTETDNSTWIAIERLGRDPLEAIEAPGLLIRLDERGRPADRIALPVGLYPRAVIPCRDGILVAGECRAEGGKGPLGHALYAACISRVTRAEGVVDRVTLGDPGANGITAASRADALGIVGGWVAGRLQVIAFPIDAIGALAEGRPTWTVGLDDFSAIEAIVPAPAGGVLVVGATDSSPTSVGRGAAIRLAADGRRLWTWRADYPSYVYAAAADRDGWLLAGRGRGRMGARPWVAHLTAEGHQDTEWPAASEVRVGRYSAVSASGSQIGLLVDGAGPEQPVSFEARSISGERQRLEPIFEGTGCCLVAGSDEGTWRIAGARYLGNSSPLRPILVDIGPEGVRQQMLDSVGDDRSE